MARTKLRVVYPPRDPSKKPAQIGDVPYASISNPSYCAYPVIGQDDTAMLVPGGRYPYEGDASEDADCFNEPEVTDIWKTCEAFAKLNNERFKDTRGVNRILQFKGRDQATGFALVELPAGPSLEQYIYYQHRQVMYPNSGLITDTYRPLIYCWAMQILSALVACHHAGITHMNVSSTDYYWIRGDLSLALVGFMGADLRDLDGQHHRGTSYSGIWTRDHCVPDSKFDLFDWATLVYSLMTGQFLPQDFDRYAMVDGVIRSESLPAIVDGMLGRFVHGCWKGEYESAGKVLDHIVLFLSECGLEVKVDEIVGLEIQQFESIERTRVTLGAY